MKKLSNWLVFVACGLMILLVNIDMTIVNLSLPSISHYFNTSLNQAQWVIANYLLITAVTFTLFGKLADDFGKKRVYLLGVSVFTLASLLAGVAFNLDFLVVARLLQGLGFAATLGLSIVIIVQTFPANKSGYMTGLAITLSGGGQALGPIIGGVILQHFSWHWIFIINLPFGIISFGIGSFFIAADKQKIKLNNLNFINVLSFLIGLALFLYTLNQMTFLSLGWAIFLFIVSISCLLLFAYTSFKFRKPLIDLTLLVNHPYLQVLFTRFVFMMCMASFLFLIPLYLENMVNFSPAISGGIMLFTTVIVAVTSPLTGNFLDRIGFFRPLLISLLSTLVSTVLMLCYDLTISWWVLIPSLVIFGIAMGMHIPASINGALRAVPKEKSGTAIGLFFTAAISGCVTGIAIVSGVVNVVSKHYLHFLLGKAQILLPQKQLQLVISAAKGVQNPNYLLQQPQLREFSRLSFLHAFHVFWLIEIVFLLIAIWVCWQLRVSTSED